jgi:hypothetical protein
MDGAVRVGVVAGLVGTAVSIALVKVFSLHLALVWALLVLPISVLLACVAAVVPAWRAARLRPLAAVRPTASRGRGQRPVEHLVPLALVNLRRLPARTLVGAAGLAIGVGALTLLLAIERSYHGTLVGTLLGNALAVQVRGADLAAIALTIALAAFSVADVLYVNLRDRAAEIVTLRSSGWSERQLSLLVGLEALGLGLGGSLVGALLGVALTAALLSVSLGPLAAAAALAALGGTVSTIVASFVPLSRLRRRDGRVVAASAVDLAAEGPLRPAAAAAPGGLVEEERERRFPERGRPEEPGAVRARVGRLLLLRRQRRVGSHPYAPA